MKELLQIKRKPAFICINYSSVRSHTVRLVFFSPYPWNEAPSQRFRYEQYLNLLREKGFKITLFSFYNQSTWKKLYTRSPAWQFLQVVKGLLIALIRIPHALKADFVFVHREITPVGPPFVEWLLAKVFQKKIIYDFDDAIWLTDKRNESLLERVLRNREKVSAICKWSYRISCGNQYLIDFAKRYNNNVFFLPTTIDTTNQHNSQLYTVKEKSKKLTIGWTGTHSTLKYLEDVFSILASIDEKYDIEILIIANKKPPFTLKSLRFIEWNKQTEIEDLLKIDIGLMPLPDDEWTKGKGGFKALQFMALGIPCIASPVGINSTIITNGENSFLAYSNQDWFDKIEKLLLDKEMRIEMGKKGRQTVLSHYSVEANSIVFLSLFEK